MIKEVVTHEFSFNKKKKKTIKKKKQHNYAYREINIDNH